MNTSKIVHNKKTLSVIPVSLAMLGGGPHESTMRQLPNEAKNTEGMHTNNIQQEE